MFRIRLEHHGSFWRGHSLGSNLIGVILGSIWRAHVCVLCRDVGDGLRVSQGCLLEVFVLLVLLVERVLGAERGREREREIGY